MFDSNYTIKTWASTLVLALALLATGCDMRRAPHALWRQGGDVRPTIGVTVFIHGTVGVSLSLMREDFLCAFRNHPQLEQDQILGREGLHAFVADSADPKHASTHVIPVYDAVRRTVDGAHSTENYLLFGWSGQLSQAARKKAGFDLYDALCDYRDSLKKESGVESVFTIVAHSHGGNVALWLAEAEQQKGRKLSVEFLYMLGTPMQVETVPYILSPLFKGIALGYSHGDGIAGNDRFSTKTHKSYKRMTHLLDLNAFVAEHPGYIRCDMRYMVNRESKRVTHPNMWLMGRSKKLSRSIDPLPLAIFVPQFMSACYAEPECTDYVAHLDITRSSCCTYVTRAVKGAQGREKLGLSDNMYDLIIASKEQVEQEWKADDKTRSLIFNRKNVWAIKDAFKEAFIQ